MFLSSHHSDPEIINLTEGITSCGYVRKNSGETVLLASSRLAFRLRASYVALQEKTAELQDTTEELRVANDRLVW